MLEAIGFDFDDTIIRTEEALVKTATKIILDKFGKRILVKNVRNPDFSKEQLEKDIADTILSRGFNIENLLTSYGVKPDSFEIDDVLREIVNISERVLKEIKESTLFKGVRKFLEHLEEIKKARRQKGQKFVLFIASHASLEWVVTILEDLDLMKHFDDIVTIVPKQEGIQKILNKYTLNPRNVLFIGDSKADYFAAMDLRMRFLGIRKSGEKGRPKELADLDRSIMTDYKSVQDKIKPFDSIISQQIRERTIKQRLARKTKSLH